MTLICFSLCATRGAIFSVTRPLFSSFTFFNIYIEIPCYQVVDLSLDNVLKPGTALPSGKQSKLPLLKRLAALTLKMMFSKNLELVIRRVQMDFSFPSSLLILG